MALRRFQTMFVQTFNDKFIFTCPEDGPDRFPLNSKILISQDRSGAQQYEADAIIIDGKRCSLAEIFEGESGPSNIKGTETPYGIELREAKQLLEEASREITSLRSTVQYTSSRLRMFDDMMQVFNIYPNGQNKPMMSSGDDIVGRINSLIKTSE